MGMVLQMRRCDVAMVAAFRTSPATIGDFIAPDDYDSVPAGELIDLDKAWHAIHFLLTGNEGEAGLPQGGLFAGEEIGEDFGLGPPRLLPPQDVKAFAVFLSSKPDDFVEQNLNFASLEEADIYPSIWDRQDPEDIQYVAEYFRSLKSFEHKAATTGDAIVMLLM